MISSRSPGFDLLRVATSVAILLFPAMALVVNHSDTILMLALSAFGIVAGFVRGWWGNFDLAQRAATLIFLLYFFVSVVSYVAGVQTEVGFHMLGRELRFLLLVPILGAFVVYRPHRMTLWGGICLGAVAAGVYAAVQYIRAGSAHGDTHHIVFGTLAFLLGVFALVFVPRSRNCRFDRLRFAVGLIAFAAGLAACVLSGSRGAWLNVLILPFVSIAFLPAARRRLWIGVALLAVAMFVALASAPVLPFRSHIDDAASAFHDYLALRSQRGDLVRWQGPSCISSRPKLEAMAPLLPRSRGVRIDVIEAPAPGNDRMRRTCGALPLYALRISAVAGRTPWAAIPRSVIGGKTAEVFASGSGTLVFWPESSTRVRVAGRGFDFYTLRGAPRNGYRVTVGLKAGNDIEVVPVAQRRGEYLDAFSEGSVGTRLQMWTAATAIFRSHPLLGVGTGAWSVVARGLSQTGAYSPVIAEYEHPHQQFLAAAACRGILGLAALLALLLIAPLSARRDPTRRSASLGCLVILSLGIAVSGLTETMFAHSIVINWFVFFVAAFLCQKESPRGEGRPCREARA